MYLPALRARRGADRRDRRGARPDGALLSRALDLLDRAEPVYLFLCAVAAVVVLARAFGEITSLTGRRQLRWIAWGTVLGVGPFALGYALPWALGVESAAGAAADGRAARPGAAGVRVGDRALSPARRRSHHQARRRLHRVPRRQRRAVSRDAQGWSASCSPTTPIRTTGSSRCWRRSSSCCWRSRSGRRCRTRSIACSIAIATTIGARWSASPAI